MKTPWSFLLLFFMTGLFPACSNHVDQPYACNDITCDVFLSDVQIRRFLDPFGAGSPLEVPMYNIQFWCGVEFTPASFFGDDARQLDSLTVIADSLRRHWSSMMASRASWGRQVMDSLSHGTPMDSIEWVWFKEQQAEYDLGLPLSPQELENYRRYQVEYGELLKQGMELRDSIMSRYPCLYDLLKKCAGDVPDYFPQYNDLQS